MACHDPFKNFTRKSVFYNVFQISDRVKEEYSYSSLAQSVERMTVNHDVAGSSPAGGAKTKAESGRTPLFVLAFSC